jgi:transcriptional regulator with XRE-family HTH domain
MPRRIAPDKLALEVGQRIRKLRQEEGLTIEQLADRSEIGSKGHLSNMERGLVRPNIQTLKQVAEGLGVLPLDLLTFPKQDVRQRLIDLTRSLSLKQLARLLKEAARNASDLRGS